MNAAVLIKRCSLIFDKYVNQLLAPYNITNSQFRILMILYKADGEIVRQIDIERELSMTNPTVTGLITSLEKNNLVNRVINSNDKRSKILVLTKEAMDRKEEFIALSKRIEREMTSNLSNNEINELELLLNKILED